MSDLSQEQQKEGLERLADPCEEGKILDKNEGREEALKELDEAGKKKGGEKKKQEELPKLSAADFRVYNSMAEHMEYFVSSRILFCSFVYVWHWKIRGGKQRERGGRTSSNRKWRANW